MSKWNILAQYDQDTNLIDLLLKNRGIEEGGARQEFLDPPNISHYVNNLSTEFKHSLKLARDKINEYISQGYPIVVYGDYDVDGICATAILHNTLKLEKNYENTFSFIPNRFDHGYGLSIGSIDEVISKIKTKYGDFEKLLFVTVDSGITAVEPASYIHSLGYELIITDHHQKPEILPSAHVILWNDNVVGATISWILSRALGSTNSQSLSLAALATVTDVQPLTNFNRTIVKKGLEILNANPPLGIKKLIEVGGKSRTNGEITTYDLGWVLGPRLNASGRMVDASDPLLLLVEQDEQLLSDIAFKLNVTNTERQDKTLEMFEIANQIDTEHAPKVIISHDEGYHEGIIGLVASRLVQKYYRPSIVISIEGTLAKGSARSVKGVDIISILRAHEDLFLNLGGHPMAAGFSIHRDNLEDLKERLTSYFDSNINDALLESKINIDLNIPLTVIDENLLSELDLLKPYGVGNSEPVFVTTDLLVAGENWMGSAGQHLSLRVTDGNVFYKAIMFNALENTLATALTVGDRVDLVYRLKRNEYNGKTTIDLIIVDLRKSKGYIN
jgi:single-stranded-DNA-specific exonuclease